MDCNRVVENLVESARRHAAPEVAARVHLSSCASCAERWENEQALAAGLRAVRSDAAGRRSSRARREAVANQFAFQHRSRPAKRWAFSFAAIAALAILSIAVFRPVAQPPVTAEFPAVLIDAPSDPEAEGFLAVPFVPPLAQGEIVRLVHTDLQPAALAELGVNVDPSWQSELPADLLVGADGFPRAVRISDEEPGSGGF